MFNTISRSPKSAEKRFLLFLFFIGLLSLKSNAQATMFQVKLDFGKSVDQPGNIINTTDGGYVVCGTLLENNRQFPFLAKISSYGQEEWRSVYEVSNLSSSGHYVAQTSDGGYILTGEVFVSAQNSDILIIRTDSSGNQLWNKSYGKNLNDRGNNIIQLPSGTFLICGESDLPLRSGVIIRIDANGTVLEDNYFSLRFGNSTVRGKLNGPNLIIVTGTGINELYTDSSGQYIGESSIALPDSVNTEDVIVTASGKHITIGNMYITTSTGHQLHIVSTDSSGSQSPIWIKKYGITGLPVSFFSKTILPSSNGGFVIAGRVTQAFGYPGWLYLIAFDSTGSMVWVQGYDPSSFGFRTGGATATSDGGYILCGSGYDGISKLDLYIIKTDSIGVSGCFEGSIPYPITTTNYTNVPPQSFITDSLQNTGTTYPVTSATLGSYNVLCYTSVPELNANTSYTLFPNPFYDHLELKSETDPPDNTTLCLFNLTGECMIRIPSQQNRWSESDMISLPDGIYIAEIRSNETLLYRTKMVHLK